VDYDVDFAMPEPTKLLIAGDWHGHYQWALNVFTYAKREVVDAILHLGDFGYWPSWDEHTMSQTGPCYFLDRVTEYARDFGIPIYWIDGNHENHDALVPGMGHDGIIRHLPRGHRWEWFGKTWMAVGGAQSVDQYVRIPHKEWFPDEVLSGEQFTYCMRDGHVDVIVAHDAPEGAKIPGLNDPTWPRDLLEKSKSHRQLMYLIAVETGATEWFHGHYHRHYQSEIGPMVITGLDMDATSIERNTYTYLPKETP
jgi:hypothetical protein